MTTRFYNKTWKRSSIHGNVRVVLKRVVAGILGALAVLASVAAFNYAEMALEDFSNPSVSVWAAIFGTATIWLLTLGAFGMGIHFLKYSFTGTFFQMNPRIRAFTLGALSFFPGFILLAPPAILLADRRWPGNTQALNLAMLVSACFGALCAVFVSLALVRKARRTESALSRLE